MGKRKTSHVIPNKAKGGWDVKKGGADRASKHFDTKKEAEKWGRDLSKKEKSEFIIHDKHGKIQKADSHGGDPFPPRDKK